VTAGAERARFRAGLAFGIAAYAAWGVVPLYWDLLRGIHPVEILAYRAVFGLGAFAGLAALSGRVRAIREAARDHRQLAVLAVAALLLAGNWGLFIHATLSGHLLQASLGYFVNPLLSVALGVVFLRERLRPLQLVAIGLAAVGVVRLAIGAGPPWIALGLAGSFGLYGLVRKTAPVAALVGSTIETALMAPLGAVYLVVLAARGGGALGHADLATHLLLAATGVVTAVPLLWFTLAARRLPLATVGFLQYLAPTGQFVIVLVAFGEPLASARLTAFGFIWAGLIAFSIDLVAVARTGPRR